MNPSRDLSSTGQFKKLVTQLPSKTVVSLSPRQMRTLEEKLYPENEAAIPLPSSNPRTASKSSNIEGQPKLRKMTPAAAGRKIIPLNNGGYVLQQLEDEIPTQEVKTTALKGAITSLKVTKGRSQIIKFAQPISRISIAEPTLAELVPLSPDQIMLNGKQRGVTSLIVWDQNGQEGIFDLQVVNDTSELLEAVNAIAPNEKIEARVTDDSFVISGQVSNSVLLDEIRKLASAYGYNGEKFVDLTETPSPQVVLEVKIAEAGRSVVHDLKTSFALDRADFKAARFQNLPAAQSATGGGAPSVGLLPPNPNNGANATTRDKAFSRQFRSQPTSNVGGLFGGLLPFAGSRANLQIAYDFLETRGKLTTLASPTLMCTHGRTASFLAGGEFPFASGTDQNGSPLISFKEFGVKLNFTPWIAVRTGRIELQVAPEVSSLDRSSCITGQAGQPVCGLLKRTSNTTVELQDGESLMISGLINREEQNSFAAVPFISSVPVLGAFFKNPNSQKRETEMVLVVTPRIIKAESYGKFISDPS